MKKIIRLTESDLVRLVKRVIKEQEEGGNDEGGNDEGGDFDYWEKTLTPQLKQKGFKLVDETKAGGRKCPGNCCKYFVFGNHNTGVNVFLNCGSDPFSSDWKITVYYSGDKGLRDFNPDEMGAKQAVSYALSLVSKGIK